MFVESVQYVGETWSQRPRHSTPLPTLTGAEGVVHDTSPLLDYPCVSKRTTACILREGRTDENGNPNTDIECAPTTF